MCLNSQKPDTIGAVTVVYVNKHILIYLYYNKFNNIMDDILHLKGAISK